MQPQRFALLLAVASLTACSSRGPVVGPQGRSPVSLHALWDGLPEARPEGVARGTLTLRAPIEGRILVPGGSFLMGSTPLEIERAMRSCKREQLGVHCEGEGIVARLRAEGPAHGVTLSPYFIDRTEVTVARYRRCVAAGACAAPERGRHDPRFDRPDFPVTYVDWDGAAAFCAWAGGRLPTEAEWELAARGAEERTYPWGNVYNPYLANHGALATDPTDGTDGFTGLAPVGSFPDGATPLGVLDLAGNVAEWVSDRYLTGPEGEGYEAASQVNPKGPAFGVGHVIRGGSFAEGAPWMRGASRWAAVAASPEIGFRCVADVR